MKELTRVAAGFVLACIIGVASAQPDYPRLRDRHDHALQEGLDAALDRLGLTSAVHQGKLSVALVDITSPQRPRTASVNGDRMIYAASLPKIAIMLGAFEQAHRKRLKLDAATRQELAAMIRVSSNEAATRMLHKVGKPRLAQILQSNRYQLYDPKFNGGLWVGKDYARKGAWRRDPLHNLSHGATALQTARFYYLLETGRLVTPRYSREMKTLLSDPGIQHKFVKGLSDRPDAKIFRKSGSWKQWHADSAIIEHKGHRYIVVALAESSEGGQWLADLIGPLDDLITSGSAIRSVAQRTHPCHPGDGGGRAGTLASGICATLSDQDS